MRGSLLFSFIEYDQIPAIYVDIAVNGILKKRIYTNSNRLYSVPLYVGDVVTITFVDPEGLYIPTLDLSRRDFTTNGNYPEGINYTGIEDGYSFSTYTFTAVTTSESYDFDYLVSVHKPINDCIWSEVGIMWGVNNNIWSSCDFTIPFLAAETDFIITTENNENINLEY